VTTSDELRLLRSRIEPLRAGVLARAERRLRGLTPTERELLESTTVQLVDEFLRVPDRFDELRSRGGARGVSELSARRRTLDSSDQEGER
jgi:glutamyl-tRNA reductase